MPHYNDPTVVHSGVCSRCDAWVRDNEVGLDDDGYCWPCHHEIENAEDDDDFPPPESFRMACEIVSGPTNPFDRQRT